MPYQWTAQANFTMWNGRIKQRTGAEIVLAAAEGRCEFGVVAGSADLGQLATKPLAVDRLTVIAARMHPLAGREAIAFAELLDEPFVGLSAGALHDHLSHHATPRLFR